MSSTGATRASSSLSVWGRGLLLWRKWAAGVVGVLFVVLFWPFIQRMIFIAADANDWVSVLKNVIRLKVSGDWSHALVIPLISLYFLVQHRQELKRLVAGEGKVREEELRPSWRLLSGLVALAGLALAYLNRQERWTGGFFLSGVVLLGTGAFSGVLGPWVIRRWVGETGSRKVAGFLRGCGLVVFILGTLSFAWWLGPGRNDMLQGYSMVVALFGLVLYVLGPGPMSVLWFPIFYLALAVKVAPRWWDMLAWNLRQVAAWLGAQTVNVLGAPFAVHADLQGTTMELWVGMRKLPGALEVEDACSGLRMLMAFIALGVAMAFLVRRLWWQRVLMVVLTVPIAVLVNVGRVVVLAFIRVWGNPEAAAGEFHLFIGMLMLIPAAGLFWLVGWVLDRLVIVEGGEERGRLVGAGGLEAGSGSEAGGWGGLAWGVAGRGVGIGVGIGVGVGAVFAAALGAVRPDLLGVRLPGWGAGILLVVAMVFLGGVGFWGWRWHREVGKAAEGGRWFRMATAVGLLIVAVAGLGTVVRVSKVVLFKERIDLRMPLYSIPLRVGTWEGEELEPLPEEQVQTLGTREYIRRVYRDVTRMPGQAGSQILLHVAYYTGTPDTVPHVPERCFVAGGLRSVGSPVPVKVELTGWMYQRRAEGSGYIARRVRAPFEVILPTLEIPATLFAFHPPEQPQAVSSVVYFFAANGKFLPNPDVVRLHAFDPRDRYSYYCKVEVLIYNEGEVEAARRRASEFLSELMPEIMACLPDWEAVRQGEVSNVRPAG